MYTYTLEELLKLSEAIDAADLGPSIVESSIAAINNVSTIIDTYRKYGPDKILKKIVEFADIGRLMFSVLKGETSSYVVVYNLIYENNLDDMPLYFGTPYEAIAVWRLQLPKKVME